MYENLKSPFGVNIALVGVLAETFVERSSSPITQVSAGTIIGNTSIYRPVATLINTLLINLAGMASATPAVIASVIIPVKLTICAFTIGSASTRTLVYCATIDVELSPVNA